MISYICEAVTGTHMGFNEKSGKGHLAMLTAYIIFGLNIPITKSVFGIAGITGLSVTFYRMAGAAVLFWAASLFAKKERVPLRDIGILFLASMFGIVLNQLPFVVGISLTSPIDASVITTLVPMITMVLSALFLKEPITWKKAAGVLIGASGALMLILSVRNPDGRGGASALGDVLCVMSAFSFSIYLTAFKRLINTYSSVTMMKWMFLFAAIVCLPICWGDVTVVDYQSLSWHMWLRLGFIVVLATFTTFFLIPIGQRFLRPTVVGMYNYMQPIVSSIVAIAVGMDTFGPTKGIATLLVFMGVWLVNQSKSRAQLEKEKKANP